jgi:hypothetical protein
MIGGAILAGPERVKVVGQRGFTPVDAVLDVAHDVLAAGWMVAELVVACLFGET